MTENSYTMPLRRVLFTDLYELTMAQAYDAEKMEGTAVFELFFRNMPSNRDFILAAGLADVLDFLENLHISDNDLAYLREQSIFSDPFLERLKALHFSGEVAAVPEGTPIFADEPLIQVVAPIFEAQLVETFILNQIHFQSLAATKAARVVLAAAGRQVVDFGSRRAHGVDAALKVARTSYLAGATGTSNVLAGSIYNIPIFGTMAHSYVQAHDDEMQTLEAFAALYPHTTLLVDTYDTLAGVRKVVELSHQLQERFQVKAIRLDSGDLGQLARHARQILDEAGLEQVKIFASSELDEYAITELLQAQAPIDGFGVGTKLAVSPDAPDLDMAYKLVEYAGRPRMKLSSSKKIYPGRKQVFRQFENGCMQQDVIGRWNESLAGEPLLQTVMRNGQRVADTTPSLEASRCYAADRLHLLPAHCRLIPSPDDPSPDEQYSVTVSSALSDELDRVQAALKETT